MSSLVDDLLVGARPVADPDLALDLPPRLQHQLAGPREFVRRRVGIPGIARGDEQELVDRRVEREPAVGAGPDHRDIRPAIESPRLHQEAQPSRSRARPRPPRRACRRGAGRPRTIPRRAGGRSRMSGSPRSTGRRATRPAGSPGPRPGRRTLRTARRTGSCIDRP